MKDEHYDENISFSKPTARFLNNITREIDTSLKLCLFERANSDQKQSIPFC